SVAEVETGGTFSCYPNPVSSQLTIDSRQMAIKTVEIYNVMGEMVMKKKKQESRSKNQEATLDVSELSNGIYIVVVSDEKTSVRGRVIVQR
ncbi:MAG: T9SS type A sorting domain-containing protein, partial [Bacteroidota bacterium]